MRTSQQKRECPAQTSAGGSPSAKYGQAFTNCSYFIQQIFTEYLLCARKVLGPEDSAVNRDRRVSVFKVTFLVEGDRRKTELNEKKIL